MASCSPYTDPAALGLYVDSSTSCSYYSNQTNFTHIPESTLASIHSNCTWLASIISRKYTTQRVWRELLPATIYESNFTNCYGEQYMDHFNLSSTSDCDYSSSHGWLIPRGLGSLAESCISSACRSSGATGNPDIAGIGMLVAYAIEAFFIIVFYLSQLTGGRGATGDDSEAYNDVIHRRPCPPVTAHEKCAGGVGKCDCSAVMIHSECCEAFHERKESALGARRHKRAMKETTQSFLDAAIFFALSIGIGAVGTASTEGFSRYEGTVLGFAFLLTSSPLYIVLAFSFETLRRKRLRRSLTSLVFALFFCAICLILSAPPESNKRERWGAICLADNRNSPLTRDTVPLYIILFVVVLECFRGLFWVFWLALKRCRPSRGAPIETPSERPSGHLSRRGCWQSVLSFWKRYIYNWTSERTSIWVVASCCLAATLFAGVSLALERARMQTLAGKPYQESEMTYGQYLAMTIWVPVIVEYAYVWTFGVARGLEGRLSTHYTVARHAVGQHSLPSTACVGGLDQVGERRSREELQLEQTCNARSSLIPHSESTSEPQALPDSAPGRGQAYLV